MLLEKKIKIKNAESVHYFDNNKIIFSRFIYEIYIYCNNEDTNIRSKWRNWSYCV